MGGSPDDIDIAKIGGKLDGLGGTGLDCGDPPRWAAFSNEAALYSSAGFPDP
jgi:hypothetical protein